MDAVESPVPPVQEVDMEGSGLARVRHVAIYLAVSRPTVYALLESGRLPYVRIGSARRIPKEAVRAFREQNLVGSEG